MSQGAEFDSYAESYRAMHAQSIAAGGEPPEYYALYKLGVLERMFGRGFERPILDFGCGIGNLTSVLAGSFSVLDGYDPSSASLTLARERTPKARFFDSVESLPKRHYGAVLLANVLHHVPPLERPSLMSTIVELLAPGGRLVVFEHNPLNPVTRRVVSACPFDENAVLLYPWQVTRLLRDAGLTGPALDYIVFFPNALAALRNLEKRMSWLPLGAQVCAWGTRD